MKNFFASKIAIAALLVATTITPSLVSGQMLGKVQPAALPQKPQNTNACNNATGWTCDGFEKGDVPPPSLPLGMRLLYPGDWGKVKLCADYVITKNLDEERTIFVDTSAAGLSVKFDCSALTISSTSMRACPAGDVMRSPFPRALVNTPVTYTVELPTTSVLLQGNGATPSKNAGFSKSPSGVTLAHGIVRNVRIQVRGTLLKPGETWFTQTVVSPTFTFNDRAWNTATKFPKSQTVMTATYQYATASFGITPKMGREFDLDALKPKNSYNLPAYAAQLDMPCKYEYQIAFEKHMPYWSNAKGDWVEQWVAVSSDWKDIDMTKHGGANTYELWKKIRSGGVSGGDVYWDTQDDENAWTPVVEVQAVLRSNICVSGGNCN